MTNKEAYEMRDKAVYAELSSVLTSIALGYDPVTHIKQRLEALSYVFDKENREL